MIKNKKNTRIFSLVTLGILAIALPVATILVQNKQDTRNLAAGCTEQCPGKDGVLRNCTPPESDGSSADSICGDKGRVEPCGGQQFCCPAAGGAWTTDMTACPSPTPTAKPTLVPTITPVPTVAETTSILKFRVALAGVEANAECAEAGNIPLSVVVQNNRGTNKSFSNVIATKVNNTSGLADYDITVTLDNFDVTGGFSIFLKSPKNLQTKYGVDYQSEYYNKAEGKLTGVTNDWATPIFHFEKYPLLAGDVTGPDGIQDGLIDGYDFTYVKGEAIKRTAIQPHENLLADLNGNCQMESVDLTNLMLSLSAKQEQLY